MSSSTLCLGLWDSSLLAQVPVKEIYIRLADFYINWFQKLTYLYVFLNIFIPVKNK